jgi:hypothetical protein
MKLCLDELYSPRIAADLRSGRHDAISVHDRPALSGPPDGPLLAVMADERRAIVTETAGDFVPIAARLALEGREHFGVVLTSSGALLRSRTTIARHVRALDALLSERPAGAALRNQVIRLLPRY